MKLEIISRKTKTYSNNHEDSGSSYIFSIEEIKELGFRNRFPYCLLYWIFWSLQKLHLYLRLTKGYLQNSFWNLETVQVRMEKGQALEQGLDGEELRRLIWIDFWPLFLDGVAFPKTEQSGNPLGLSILLKEHVAVWPEGLLHKFICRPSYIQQVKGVFNIKTFKSLKPSVIKYTADKTINR